MKLLATLSIAILISMTLPTLASPAKISPPFQMTDTYCDVFLGKLFYQENMTVSDVNAVAAEFIREIESGNPTYCCKYVEGGQFYDANVDYCERQVERSVIQQQQKSYMEVYYYGIYYIDIILTLVLTFSTVHLVRRYSKKDGGISNILMIILISLLLLLLFYILAYVIGDMIFRV